MFKSLAARLMLPLAAVAMWSTLSLTPAMAIDTEDREKAVIPDVPRTETWPHPGTIQDNHADQVIYTELVGLLPNYKFSNELSAGRALNNHGMRLFSDSRVLSFYTANPGILVKDGTPGITADPEELRWMGSVKPVRIGNYLALPPEAPVRKAGLFQLGALAHMGHYLLVNCDTPELKPIAKNVAHEMAVITAATGLPEMAAFSAAEAAADNEKGGYSSTVQKWDAAVQRLGRYVVENYGDEGLWYYGLGADAAGTWWLYLGEDQFSAPNYFGMLNLLSAHQPVLVDPSTHQEGIDVTPNNRPLTQVVALINYPGEYRSTVYVPSHSLKLMEFYFPADNGFWSNQNKSYPKR